MADRGPQVRGDLQLLDCETGEAEDVSATAAVIESYKKAYVRFQEGLTGFARVRSAGLVRIDTEKAIVPQLAALFETGSLTV